MCVELRTESPVHVGRPEYDKQDVLSSECVLISGECFQKPRMATEKERLQFYTFFNSEKESFPFHSVQVTCPTPSRSIDKQTDHYRTGVEGKNYSCINIFKSFKGWGLHALVDNNDS